MALSDCCEAPIIMNDICRDCGEHCDDIKVETTDQYWDCECKESYIHPASQHKCSKCGATREDSPDSIVEEVMMYGFKIL